MAGVLICLLPALCGLPLSACVPAPPPVQAPPGPRLPFGLLVPPPAALVESSSKKAFEDPGHLVAYQGLGCAESDRSKAPTTLLVTQTQEIPNTMDHAAVVLSGWQFRYLEGDQELTGLATGIFDIRRAVVEDGSHRLEWQAFGIMRDGGYDDPFRWCYRFTVVAWDGNAYAAQVDQRDNRGFNGDPIGREQPFGWETALSFHPSFVEVYPSGGSASAVMLPRGFGFVWAEELADHNLLQLAYNLDPGEGFIADGKQYSAPSPNLGGADQVGYTYYSWETKTVFKDNALRRDYYSAELVSVASGQGVEAIHPSFTIAPFEDESGFCAALAVPPSESRTIDSVPYDVAIPVLTGWDLSYNCSDDEIQEIGLWIDDFAYDPGTSGPRYDGKLDYTVRSVLHDQAGGDFQRFRHRVSVLGLRKQPPTPAAASLSILPDTLRFPYPDHLGRPTTTRNAFLDNFGNAAADRTTIAVVGPDAARFQLVSQHPPMRTLAPGDSEQFTLHLAVPCGGPTPGVSWRATLRIDTTEGRFEVPLSGQPYPCAIAEG
jgi:hypothetical protein